MGEICAAARECRFSAGDALMHQGDVADGLMIMLEGRAQAVLRTADGEQSVGRFFPGDLVGEMALVTRGTRTATVVAESAVRALLVPTAEFDRLAARHTMLPIILTELVAERLGRAASDGFGGKLVDGFRILRAAGRGGMSVVYRAEDQRTGETVALKMMSYRLIYDADALSRFRDEADILRDLQHEHIAKLHRLFQAFNTYFLVMEFCEGTDLARLLDEHGPRPETQVRAILGQLAHALQYVHERGFVHRDLKPGNVMLTAGGTIKLTDFGIAVPELLVNDARGERHRVIGTPEFMAPEQLAGGPIDRRADVYALACIAYELLTGRPLFATRDIVELAQLKLDMPARVGGMLDHVTDRELAHFIQSSLSVDPNERPSLQPLTAWAARCEVAPQSPSQ